jgi:hypothetical protein
MQIYGIGDGELGLYPDKCKTRQENIESELTPRDELDSRSTVYFHPLQLAFVSNPLDPL